MIQGADTLVNASEQFERPPYSYQAAGKYAGYNPFFAGNQGATWRGADWNWLSLYMSPLSAALQSGSQITTQKLTNATVFQLYLPNMTPGSVFFAGNGGLVSQNNASFFWDSTNLRLQAGAGGAVGTPQSVFGYFTNANPDPSFSSGNDQFRIGEGRPMGNPPNAPTAVAGGGGLTGNYQYAYIELDASGNPTGLSPTLSVTAASNQYTVTVSQSRPGALARILCRTKAGGSTFYLLHDFAAGDHAHQTSWLDNTADGSLTTVIGTISTADATKLYKMVGQVNTQWGGIFCSTHPDQASFAQDLTLLMGNPGTGKVTLDCYSGISVRSVASAALATRVTGTNASAFHIACGFLGTTDDGTSQNIVFSLDPVGRIAHSPASAGITNPTWHKLTGGVAGNYLVMQVNGTNNLAGFYMNVNNEVYLGSNINYSGGDTYSTSNATGPWRIGNPLANTFNPFHIDVAVSGTAGNAISWTTALTFTAGGATLLGTNASTAGQLNFPNNTTIQWRNAANTGDLNVIKVDSGNQLVLGFTAMNIFIGGGGSNNVGFFGGGPVGQQTSGANLANNVTSGGTNDIIANYTDLVTYANDAAAIRNDIYQLSRKLKQINDGLRAFGMFT